MNNIDLVIVGAGSAGCILANKLINNTNYTILLIEAGPKDNSLIIDIPLGYGMTFYNKKINWNFYSKKQNRLNNREIYYPRGKVLGGSSSINGMVYARGLDTDYADWSDNDFWSLENIKNSFKEIEQKIDQNFNTIEKNKIPVNDVSNLHHPILKYFFDGCEELNIKFNKNLNTENFNQVGHYNINTFKGIRQSSSKIFLKPIFNNDRIKIMNNTKVQKLILKDNKVVSLVLQSRGNIFKIKPKIGTILSSGSIMTPYILMHSGIGDPKKIKSINKEVIIDNPNVGKNLQDHLGLDYLFRTLHPSLNSALGTWSGRIKEISKYIYNKKGAFALSLNQGGGYLNWNSKHNYPNLQIYFNPITYSITHKNKRPLLKTDKFDGFIIGYNSCRPKSLGDISLKSPSTHDMPIIDPNFLNHEEDIHDVLCAIDFAKTLAKTKSISNIREATIKNDLLNANDQEMLNHFRNNAVSVYHPCGTCRMSNNKNNGVVSKRLKVHGIDNLWVVDASIFPNITSGNINATVMMLANLGSKLIIEDIKKI